MRLKIVTTAITSLSLALSVIFLQSCTKDQPNSAGISDPESRIKKVIFDSSYISIGFTTLSYVDDKLVNIHLFDSIHNSSWDYDISYPAQNQVKVVSRPYANQYHLYSYDRNNTLAKVEYATLNSGQWYKTTLTLHTSNNKLDSVTNDAGASDPSRILWKYKYDGYGNIVQFVRAQKSSYQVDTVSFSYDSRSNLYQKNQLYFFITFAYMGGSIGETAIPYLFSKNNVVSVKWGSSSSTTINYKTDSIERITGLFYNQYYGDGNKFYY